MTKEFILEKGLCVLFIHIGQTWAGENHHWEFIVMILQLVSWHSTFIISCSLSLRVWITIPTLGRGGQTVVFRLPVGLPGTVAQTSPRWRPLVPSKCDVGHLLHFEAAEPVQCQNKPTPNPPFGRVFFLYVQSFLQRSSYEPEITQRIILPCRE